jgi:hypothetical protein
MNIEDRFPSIIISLGALAVVCWLVFKPPTHVADRNGVYCLCDVDQINETNRVSSAVATNCECRKLERKM